MSEKKKLRLGRHYWMIVTDAIPDQDADGGLYIFSKKVDANDCCAAGGVPRKVRIVEVEDEKR